MTSETLEGDDVAVVEQVVPSTLKMSLSMPMEHTDVNHAPPQHQQHHQSKHHQQQQQQEDGSIVRSRSPDLMADASQMPGTLGASMQTPKPKDPTTDQPMADDTVSVSASRGQKTSVSPPRRQAPARVAHVEMADATENVTSVKEGAEDNSQGVDDDNDDHDEEEEDDEEGEEEEEEEEGGDEDVEEDVDDDDEDDEEDDADTGAGVNGDKRIAATASLCGTRNSTANGAPTYRLQIQLPGDGRPVTFNLQEILRQRRRYAQQMQRAEASGSAAPLLPPPPPPQDVIQLVAQYEDGREEELVQTTGGVTRSTPVNPAQQQQQNKAKRRPPHLDDEYDYEDDFIDDEEEQYASAHLAPLENQFFVYAGPVNVRKVREELAKLPSPLHLTDPYKPVHQLIAEHHHHHHQQQQQQQQMTQNEPGKPSPPLVGATPTSKTAKSTKQGNTKQGSSASPALHPSSAATAAPSLSQAPVAGPAPSQSQSQTTSKKRKDKSNDMDVDPPLTPNTAGAAATPAVTGSAKKKAKVTTTSPSASSKASAAAPRSKKTKPAAASLPSTAVPPNPHQSLPSALHGAPPAGSALADAAYKLSSPPRDGPTPPPATSSALTTTTTTPAKKKRKPRQTIVIADDTTSTVASTSGASSPARQANAPSTPTTASTALVPVTKTATPSAAKQLTDETKDFLPPVLKDSLYGDLRDASNAQTWDQQKFPGALRPHLQKFMRRAVEVMSTGAYENVMWVHLHHIIPLEKETIHRVVVKHFTEPIIKTLRATLEKSRSALPSMIQEAMAPVLEEHDKAVQAWLTNPVGEKPVPKFKWHDEVVRKAALDHFRAMTEIWSLENEMRSYQMDPGTPNMNIVQHRKVIYNELSAYWPEEWKPSYNEIVTAFASWRRSFTDRLKRSIKEDLAKEEQAKAAPPHEKILETQL